MENKAGLSALRVDAGTVHDVSEEFTLPDYLPEIRQIVSCRCTVLPENKYQSDSGVGLSGLLTYTVTYVGDDGALSAVPLNSEYSATVPCSAETLAGTPVSRLGVPTSAETVNCRATAPRRLSLSCRMRSRVIASAPVKTKDKLTGSGGETAAPADETLEKRTVGSETSTLSFASHTGAVSGELRLREGTTIVSCGGSAGIGDVRADGDDVTVRGDVFMNVLLLGDDGRYSTERVKSPFEEKIALKQGEVPEGSKKSASCDVRVASVNVNGGEGGAFTWDVEYDVDAILSCTYGCTVTADAYSTEYESEVRKGSAESLLTLRNANSRLSVNGSSPFVHGESRYVAGNCASASLDRAEYDSGRITLTGNCTVSVLIVGEGEAVSEDVTLPFRHECEAGAYDGAAAISANVCVITADARLDGDRLVCDAELGFSVLAFAHPKVSFVEDVTLDTDRPAQGMSGSVKIYFPDKDETEWDVGKKYKVKQSDVRTLDGGTPMVIIK